MSEVRILALLMRRRHDMNGVMTECLILFNQTSEDLRRIGARGGRAYGRNCRARRKAGQSARPATVLPMVPPVETTAEAVAALDAQFPWLRGAERRCDPPRQ